MTSDAIRRKVAVCRIAGSRINLILAIPTIGGKWVGNPCCHGVRLVKADLSDKIAENNPEILMLSNYLWNHNLNVSFARAVRQFFPETLIIMGGPNISVDNDARKNFYLENDFVDGYVL